ncbi:MAG: HAMP domain-containing protein [Acidimicrobiales bacterium]
MTSILTPPEAGTPGNGSRKRSSASPDETAHLEELLYALQAARHGDFSVRLPARRSGIVGRIAAEFNALVETNAKMTKELGRVARAVGRDGRLGERVVLPAATGGWAQDVESVNGMIDSLARPTTEVARVIAAVADGDLSQKMALRIGDQPVRGEFLRIGRVVNAMVDQLGSFSSEVSRVAREVGTEGRLGGQAQVQGVSGTWRDLTENVNQLAGNLTGQVRNIAQVTTAVAQGDLSQKITVDARGEVAALRDTINNMVDQLRSFAAEVTRVAREVGTDGRLGGQAQVEGVSGTWKDLTENVNQLAGNLTDQVRNIAQVTTAVARGDLTQKITVEARGEVAALKSTINTMVDQLSAFADEVTRVAREVGTEGKLGGQAQVQGVSGTWRDLTENVNFMADNLTDQVRNIAQVTTAVARGELNKKITVDARGEILELKNTINTMVDQLSSFAAEVTRVGKEVGTEGRLGGQAEVEGVSGTWKGLTDNVNTLASTLTTQLRAIAEVSTAVTQGDLSRQIAVEAQGEVAELKDNINQMIANLRDTTQKNAEQDWLKTNLARISGLMQGQRDLRTVSRLIMSELTPVVSAQVGGFFLAAPDGSVFNLLATYGYRSRDGVATSFASGEGLVGQAAIERKSILITEAPKDYIRISSGLGEATPVNIIVIPVLFEDEVRAVIELASFQPFTEVHLTFLDQLRETIGVVLNTIIANMRTEELLEQSQSYARLLEEQNRDIEVKNREIELAQVALQERAEQLALSSKYKSEFLANMSHELRTPLNSLLILARLLAEDPNDTLTPKQVEYAQTIHAAGSDLLALISDILDLSKVEAGKMDLLPAQTAISKVALGIDQEFRPVAEQRGLHFECEVAAGTPEAIVTDEQRLQQVLRNLLSNAMKFTERGTVRLRVGPAPAGINFLEPSLRTSPGVLAFSVSDTGIGVSEDKLRLIFESFQQADGTISRRYGGTGLGLSISREIAHLLGGEIRVESKVGAGSVFTLYVPAHIGEASSSTSVVVAPGLRDVPIISTDAAAASPSLPVVLLVGLAPGSIDLSGAAVEVEQVDTASEAVAALERGPVDCVVVDLSETSADGFALLERVQKDPSYQELPFVAYAVRALNKREETRLARYAESIHVHRASDPDALAREVGAALHVRNGRRQIIETAFSSATTPDLAGRRVLIIDDDVRNVFALTSALEASGMEVLFAENGRDGLQVLEAHPEVELVLLDIMMPEMDGYETAAAIRVQARFSDLPIIVLTAKAMAGDRERAVEAGASDYVTKPVDLPHLLSVMHSWLNR